MTRIREGAPHNHPTQVEEVVLIHQPGCILFFSIVQNLKKNIFIISSIMYVGYH